MTKEEDQRMAGKGIPDSRKKRTIRFLCVRLITRRNVTAWSLDWDGPGWRPRLNLAVLSSSSSPSSFLYSPAPVGEAVLFDLEVNGFSLRLVKADVGLMEGRLTFSRLSPVLPLPVELVAGGEGRPEWEEEDPGLGGSGRSGSSEDWVDEGAGGPSPRKIADKGRRLEAKEERDVIELKGSNGRN